MSTETLSFDDYLRALVYRAYDLRDGDPAQYTAALHDIAAAPGRWPFVRWHIEIAAAHDHADRVAQARVDAFDQWMLDLADWLDAKGLL